MRNYRLLKPIYTSLLALMILTACNGQTNAVSKTEKVDELQSTLAPAPKIKKPQDKNTNKTIHCGLVDQQGNIWFGTTGEGVFRYDGKLFTQFTMKDGLSSNCIWSIMEDRSGTIWFGTSEGICRIDGPKIISVPIDENIRPNITDNSYYTSWSTKSSVWSMMQDKSGKIWFGTGDGMYCYNGFSFSRLLANDGIINKDGLHLKVVADMLEDKNGIIWFFSGILPGSEGIAKYDGKTIERFKPRELGWNRNALFSKNGTILVATRNYGIWSFDGKTFTDFPHPKGLIKSSINYILEDKAGSLWIGSDYGKEMGDTLAGLWYSTTLSGNSTAIIYTKIFNKEVYFVLEDKNDHIWFSTSNMGLYRYDRKTLTAFSE